MAVVWFFYMAVVPFGKIVYVQNFKNDKNYFIQKLTPAERVKETEGGSQKIIGNPVYFALRTPRRFNYANLEIKYKNNSNLPIIEAGVLMDKTVWRYDVKPVENKVIDDLVEKWEVLRQNGIMLLQKQKRYNSIDEFLENLPSRSEIALYNYNLENKFLLADYQASSQEKVINQALRGNYQIYTYIKNEDLDFDFSFQDINVNKDTDPIEINLYYENQLIDSRHLDDDGIASDNGAMSQIRELKLLTRNLSEGVYKIEIKANDDIITKKITTKQNKIGFIDRIWLADDNKRNFSIYTDSNYISAQTINPAKLQELQSGDKKLDLKETYKQFDLDLARATSSEIKLQKDDVIISGNGVFSFDREQLINPDFEKVNYRTKIENSNINYILANYESPKIDDGWKIANVELDLNNAYREFSKYSIMFAIPGLKTDDDIDDNIEIKEIKVELEGTTLWEKIKKLLN